MPQKGCKTPDCRMDLPICIDDEQTDFVAFEYPVRQPLKEAIVGPALQNEYLVLEPEPDQIRPQIGQDVVRRQVGLVAIGPSDIDRDERRRVRGTSGRDRDRAATYVGTDFEDASFDHTA